MYKVTYYITGGSMVSSRSFETLSEATNFAIHQPIESVIEIKKYEDTTNNIQNKSNNFRPD
jgi:hypothetical protein